jgi:hypothetical protein
MILLLSLGFLAASSSSTLGYAQRWRYTVPDIVV